MSLGACRAQKPNQVCVQVAVPAADAASESPAGGDRTQTAALAVATEASAAMMAAIEVEGVMGLFWGQW